MARPLITSTKRQTGIAGQFQLIAQVKYDDEPETTISFVGSTFGGPVVMVTPDRVNPGKSHQTFVTDPGRHGNFGDDPHAWVRSFFA